MLIRYNSKDVGIFCLYQFEQFETFLFAYSAIPDEQTQFISC